MKTISYTFMLIVLVLTQGNSQDKILWIEHEFSSINIANIDKSESQVIFENFVHEPSTIYYDSESKRLFWGNKEGQTIASTSIIDTKDFKNHHRGLKQPRSIFIDNTNGWIYYGDANVASIERVRFDGSDEERLFRDNSGLAVYGLEVDIQEDKMFFSTGKNIHVSKLDGSDESIIVPDVKTESLFWDRSNKRLYWTEPVFVRDGFIKSCNLDGSDIDTLPIISKEPQSIEIDVDNEIIYWSDPDEEAIYAANLDGSSKRILVDLTHLDYLNIVTIELDKQNGYLYYSADKKNAIFRVELDGQNNQLYIEDKIDAPIEVVYDQENNKLLIADEYRGILQSNLDGSEYQELLNMEFIDGIAVDNDFIYYVDWKEKQMMRMSRDGKSKEAIIDDVCCISDIEVKNNVLYWIDSKKDAIYSANLDGTNVSKLIDDTPKARSLKVSTKDEKIYWTNRTISVLDNVIYSSDLDGSNISIVARTNRVQYIGWLALDDINDKLYYSQGTNRSRSIYRVNKDGSENELVFETEDEPRGVDVFFNATSTYESNNELQSIVNIFPNPVSEELKFKTEDDLDLNLKLYDLNGQLLIEKKNVSSIDVSQLEAGVYLVKIENVNIKKSTFKKLIIAR